MVNVEFLVENAIFGDAYGKDPETGTMQWSGSSVPQHKEKCMIEKLYELSDEFISSIQNEGVKTPICYNPDQNMVENGHHRLIAAWLLGIKEIPYVMDKVESWRMEEHSLNMGNPSGRP